MKLMFYKAKKGNWLDKVINLGSGRHGYSHVELVFDQIDINRKNGYLCYSCSPRDKYVRFKYIDPYRNDHWDLVELPHDFNEEQYIYKKSLKYVGAEYDYYGIFFWYVLFFVKKQNDHQWWCSEIIAYLLGIEDFRLTPNELAIMYGLEKVK